MTKDLKEHTVDARYWADVTKYSVRKAINIEVLKKIRDLNPGSLTEAQAYVALGELKSLVRLIDLERYEEQLHSEPDEEVELLNKLQEDTVNQLI